MDWQVAHTRSLPAIPKLITSRFYGTGQPPSPPLDVVVRVRARPLLLARLAARLVYAIEHIDRIDQADQLD
ncbi:hypothetical protein ONA91_39915 [Micromonospora sp. DR5-3]|uniref:hypothetical protein n=1 Tax=unclassified Micromonospora TaxID=2617518 RepID=UPI0011D778E3|nr:MULTISPECIES: hypothetical protein [unclassified Micromonospora]MCW3820617.1 hypothetical protein [Micromonospora sp. DR5-3]TYC19048.1 hypothetical protein FXF52_38710 [Micromonospora sp. MP36]